MVESEFHGDEESAYEVAVQKEAREAAEEKEQSQFDWGCSLCDWTRNNKTRVQVRGPFSGHNKTKHGGQAELMKIS